MERGQRRLMEVERKAHWMFRGLRRKSPPRTAYVFGIRPDVSHHLHLSRRKKNLVAFISYAAQWLYII